MLVERRDVPGVEPALGIEARGALPRVVGLGDRRTADLLLILILTAGCREAAPDVPSLDPVATRYTALVLALGEHDLNYVDAYYGPDSVRLAVRAESL